MGQNSFILNDNFGIGTSDPLSPLDVRFSNTSLPTTGSGSIIRLGNTDLTTSSTSSIIFLGYDAGGTQRHGAAISWLKTGSWTAGGNNYGSTLIFSTRADAGDTVARFHITNAGGISFGATGTNYGSSGQFLTSQGNASPTWTTVSYSTLTLNTSGIGLSGSTTYTPAGAATFTVTSNATTTVTASAIVARDANGDDFRRYGFAAYFNSSDDVSEGNISHIMAKFGDNYHRSATAAKVAAFISGQSMNINGNATTATNLSTNRTNWSTNGTITAVVGQLAWKAYGNSHTIFDASQSTSPDGGAVNNTNSQVAWTGTYPTLMGWNGGNTFGVRVDSARLADSATTATTVNASVLLGSGSFPAASSVTIPTGALTNYNWLLIHVYNVSTSANSRFSLAATVGSGDTKTIGVATGAAGNSDYIFVFVNLDTGYGFSISDPQVVNTQDITYFDNGTTYIKFYNITSASTQVVISPHTVVNFDAGQYYVYGIRKA